MAKVDLKNQLSEARKLDKPLATLFALLAQREPIFKRLSKAKKEAVDNDPVLGMAYTAYVGLRAYFGEM